MVEVGYGAIPNSAFTAREILNDRAADLEGMRAQQPALRVDPAIDLRMGSFSGSILSFTARENRFQFREWWAIALLDDVSYAQVTYHASAMDLAAENRIRIIAASLGSGDEVVGTPIPAGFSRRRAGRISLLVPTRLEPPATFVFGSQAVTLSIAVSASPIAWSLPVEEILNLKTESGIIAGVPGMVKRFVRLPNEFEPDRRWAYLQGNITFDDGVTVRVEGKAPIEQSDNLDDVFRGFIRNIRRAE